MPIFLPITGNFGAEVEGVDVAAELDPAIVAELKQALLEFKVLVFLNQRSLTTHSQARFAEHFGTLAVKANPFHPSLDAHPAVSVLRTNEKDAQESWHTDLGFEAEPNLATMLRAVEVPEYGRDTMFADTEAAYDGLSPVMKEALKNLTAVRDWRQIYGDRGQYAGYANKETVAKAQEELPARAYPVVAVNEDTGRRAINVDKTFTTHIEGMRADESAVLLRFLFDQMHFPEYQLRVRWKLDSLVMWDNRTTQHALVFDRKFPRVMHRVITKGRRLFPDKPVRREA